MLGWQGIATPSSERFATFAKTTTLSLQLLQGRIIIEWTRRSCRIDDSRPSHSNFRLKLGGCPQKGTFRPGSKVCSAKLRSLLLELWRKSQCLLRDLCGREEARELPGQLLSSNSSQPFLGKTPSQGSYPFAQIPSRRPSRIGFLQQFRRATDEHLLLSGSLEGSTYRIARDLG